MHRKNSTQISNWKKQALQGIVQAFSSGLERRQKDQGEVINELYSQIGQLKVEMDWVKKT